MRHFVIAFFAILVFIVTVPVPKSDSAYAAAAAPDGKEVFLKYKCDNCHTVSTAGITAKTKSKAPDLVDVTLRHEKPWIRKFIRQNETHVPCNKVDPSLDGKKHPIKFAGSQEEEDALIAWLDEQRSGK